MNVNVKKKISKNKKSQNFKELNFPHSPWFNNPVINEFLNKHSSV